MKRPLMTEQLALKKKLKVMNEEWYDLRPILGNANWALFYLLLGGREAGKSYSVTDFFCRQISAGI